MECSRLLTHVNDAITTHYDHSIMCNDAVTAPKWTSKIGQPSRTSQHVAVSKHMQDFDPFAKRRCTQKLDCGSLSRLQDPYELR